jgi:hypothetical protein
MEHLTMPTTNEIIEFVKENRGLKNITGNTDIFGNGITGDDFHELIEAFAKTYSVDMTNYLWYFHANEEGHNLIGEIFFPPPYKRVKRIPITPSLLTEFANKGKWNMKYPKHQIPKKRYDLLINIILIIAFIFGGIVVILKVLIQLNF